MMYRGFEGRWDRTILYARSIRDGMPPVGHSGCRDFPRCDQLGGHCGTLLVPDETTPTDVADQKPEDIGHKIDEHAKRLRMVEQYIGLSEERYENQRDADDAFGWSFAAVAGLAIGATVSLLLIARYQDVLFDAVDDLQTAVRKLSAQ